MHHVFAEINKYSFYTAYHITLQNT